MVRGLSSSKVGDDDIEVSRDATEESRKFLEKLRRKDDEILGTFAIGRKFLRQVSLMVEKLVVPFSNHLTRVIEETE